MNDMTRLGAAVVGGYLLGRTRKGKAALRLALWFGLRNVDPGALLRDGAARLSGSAGGELLAQLHGPMADAAKRAATATLDNRLNTLADALHQHTEAMRPPRPEGERDGRQGAEPDSGQSHGSAGEEQPEDQDEAAGEPEPEDREAPGERQQAEPEPAPRSGSRRRSASSAAGRSGRASGGPGGRAAPGARRPGRRGPSGAGAGGEEG